MLSFLFKINNIVRTTTYSAIANIYENEHKLVKRRYFDKEIPIVHCANQASKTSEKIVEIDHIESGNQILKQKEVRANRVSGEYYVFNRSRITWEHSNLLVTNQLASETPLFWGHRLPLNSIDVKVLVNGFEVSSEKYKVLQEINKEKEDIHVTIAHNFEHKESGRYYVRYELNGVSYLELLNRERLFNRTYDFIPEFYSGTNKLLCLYKVIKSKEKLQIVLPEDSGRVCIQEPELLLSGSLPHHQFSNENWFLEIPAFEFSEGVLYECTEYDDQFFEEGKPFKRIRGDVGIVEGNRDIRISHKEIQKENIHLYLYKEDDDHPSLLLTNNPSLSGQIDPSSGLSWELEELHISAWDHLIMATRSLLGYSFAKANYSVRSYSYFVEDIDLNPFFNSEVLGSKVYFYLHPQNGLLWFRVNKQGILVETNKDLYESYIDKSFEKKESEAHSGFSFLFGLNTVYLKEVLIAEGSKLLAIVHQPRFYEEGDTIFTKITYQDIPEVRESFRRKQKYLPLADNEIEKGKWSVPELSKTYLTRIHWTKLREYIPYERITKKSLLRQLNKNLPAHIQSLIIEEGVPFIEARDINLEDELVTLEWIPLIRNKNPIGGTIYRSVDGKFFIGAGFIDDMSQTSSVTLSLTNEKNYYRISPRVELDGEIYFGPSSNTVCISKELING